MLVAPQQANMAADVLTYHITAVTQTDVIRWKLYCSFLSMMTCPEEVGKARRLGRTRRMHGSASAHGSEQKHIGTDRGRIMTSDRMPYLLKPGTAELQLYTR